MKSNTFIREKFSFGTEEGSELSFETRESFTLSEEGFFPLVLRFNFFPNREAMSKTLNPSILVLFFLPYAIHNCKLHRIAFVFSADVYPSNVTSLPKLIRLKKQVCLCFKLFELTQFICCRLSLISKKNQSTGKQVSWSANYFQLPRVQTLVNVESMHNCPFRDQLKYLFLQLTARK